MRETFHAKVIIRAAGIRGGARALSQFLNVPLHEIQAWMRGEVPVPERVMVRLLDVIIDDTLQELPRPADEQRRLEG